MNIKVLFIQENRSAAFGSCSYALSRFLNEKGIETHTLFFDGWDYNENEDNIHRHSISFLVHGDNIFNWAMLMNNELQRRGREIFEEFGFDVIHANDWITAPCGMVLAKLTNKPLILTFNSTEHNRGNWKPHSSIISDVEWWAAFESAHVIVHNIDAFNSLIYDLNVPKEKISVIEIHKERWEEMILNIYQKKMEVVVQ